MSKKIKSGSIVVNPTDLQQGAVQDLLEDRSAYFRSDAPVTWTGTQLTFTSDIVLEILNTSSGTTSTHTILAAGSPVSLNDGESAYVEIDRTTNSENVSIIKSGTTPIPAHSNTHKNVFILCRRHNIGGVGYLNLPFSKQLFSPGQSAFLGASGSGSSGSGINFFSTNDQDAESSVFNWVAYNDTQTVTITNATPAVFTVASTTGYYNGLPIVFSTTISLPTGLTAGTTYYVTNLNVDGANKFRVSATLGGTDVATSSAGSGTHTARPLVPTTGTGASSNLTLVQTTSGGEVIRGTGSFKGSKGAANRAGEGFSCVITIPGGYASYPRNLLAKLAYTVTANFLYNSGNFASPSDIMVYFRDVTNNQLALLDVNGLDGSGQYTGQVQFDKSVTSVRICLHVATTNANAWDFIWDDAFLGPSAIAPQGILTKWQNYTPTGSWVTNTTYTGQWMRDGTNLFLELAVTLSGAPTATSLTITLPPGITIDTSGALFTGNSVLESVGGIRDSSVPQEYWCFAQAATSTSVGILVVDSAPASWGSVSSTVPITFATGDTIQISIGPLPIVGWESGAMIAVEDGNRSVMVQVTGDAASATAGNPIIFPTVTYDTHGAYNASTGEFKAPRSGYVHCHGGLLSGNNNQDIFIYVNGVNKAYIGTTDGSNGDGSYTGTVRVNAGDLVTIRPGGTVDLTPGTSSFNFEMGPTGIFPLASEKVVASYAKANSTSYNNGTTTIVDFDTKVIDTHSAVTTGASWKFTAPRTGFYRYSGKFLTDTSTNTGALSMDSYKSGTMFRSHRVDTKSSADVTSRYGFEFTSIIQLNQGDFLDVRLNNGSGATRTLNNGVQFDALDIESV